MASASELFEGYPMISLFLLLLLPFVLTILRRKFARIPPLPPGPHPWPIIGNLPHIVGEMPHVAFARLSRIYGPLISLRLGSQLVVVGSSPAAAREILKTHDRLLSGRHVPHVSYAKRPERNHVSVGWTYECTDQWKFLRTLLRNELFGSKVIENKSSLRLGKALEMVNFIKSKEGETVNIAQVVFVSIFNFLGNIFFSRNFLAFEEKDGEGMSWVIRQVMELWSTPNISDLYPILGRFDLQRLSSRAEVVMREFFSVWEGIVKERRGNKAGEMKEHRDFLDVLLDNQFSDDQINCLFLELFSAGTDTSASTVEWALAEFLRNPESMSKVREELVREIPEGIKSETQLSNLSYLHACIKETLRLHPPAPLLLPRRAIETCQVMNFNVPKDTQVYVNAWAVGRDPTIWDDPLSFRPERFLNCDLDYKGNDFEYLPFGSGRRICPGLPMGARQVQLSLASLIHHFEWSLPHNVVAQELDMTEKFGVTLQKDQPLLLIPKCIK